MARQKPKDIEKELKKQDDEVYGEETVSGSSPRPASDDDTTDNLKDVIGNEPKNDKPFTIAEEIEADELDRRGKTSSDDASEEEQEAEEEL